MSLLYWGSWIERDGDMAIISVRTPLRDGPLEKLLGGGGEFSSRRNFFSLSNSLCEFFLGYSMNILQFLILQLKLKSYVTSRTERSWGILPGVVNILLRNLT